MIGTSAVGSPPMIVQPSSILMPIFSVRKVNTSVTIFDGATVIIGGLTEEIKTVNDKIPVLEKYTIAVDFSNLQLRVTPKEIYSFLLARVLYQEVGRLFVRSFKISVLNLFLKILLS